MPGIAASTSETWVFGSPPNSVEAPENSFEFEVTWAWTSSPITISQSPVAPLISFDDLTGAFIGFGLPKKRGIGTKRYRDRLGFAQPMTPVKPEKLAMVKARGEMPDRTCSGAARRHRLRPGDRSGPPAS